jgi:hypothetical protein
VQARLGVDEGQVLVLIRREGNVALARQTVAGVEIDLWTLPGPIASLGFAVSSGLAAKFLTNTVL